MNTTELIRPPEAPTVRELLAETIPLVGVVPVAGPPAIFLAGPWLLLVLMLAGPFAVLFTLVVLLVGAALLVMLAAAILATPYLLVHRLRTGHASVSSAAVQLAPVDSLRAAP